MEKSVEEIIYVETKKRLKEMSKKSYSFPNTIQKTDVFLIVTLIVVSLILILLCMIGVIV